MTFDIAVWEVELLIVSFGLRLGDFRIRLLGWVTESESFADLVHNIFFLGQEASLLRNSCNPLMILTTNGHAFNTFIHSQELLLVF